MDILREMEKTIEECLGAWPPELAAGRGGYYAVKAEEELHAFLVAQ